jgi:Xaa-Pro aminopeptidase
MDTRISPSRLRLSQLREVMAENDVQALLVPSSDPHLSEYLPGRWQGARVVVGLHRLDGAAGRDAAARRAVR